MATVAVTASSMFVFVGNFRQFKGTFTVQLLNICPFVMHDQMCQTVHTLRELFSCIGVEYALFHCVYH